MNLLGFYLGLHDSSVAFSRNGIAHYCKSERIVGIKHHRAGLDFIVDVCRDANFIPDVIAYSDGNRNKLGILDPEQLAQQVPALGVFPDARTYYVDHHYSHILSAWPVISSDQVDVGIAVDGEGDNGLRVRVVRAPGSEEPQLTHHELHPAIGDFFKWLGRLLGMDGHHLDFAGKLMGAQSYGTIDHEFVKVLHDRKAGARITDIFEEIPWRGWCPLEIREFFVFENPSFRDWLASVHHFFSELLEGVFRKWCGRNEVVSYTGGVAQNSVFNEYLSVRYPNLFISPHGYDGGLSLGCLEYARLVSQQAPLTLPEFPFSQDGGDLGYASPATCRDVALLLAQQRIVAFVQGKGEIGPRALGHRSLLMDPRIPEGKDILNHRVKHRESWRPFAPSILEEYCSDWFELTAPSRYMLRAVPAKTRACTLTPSIVHIDGTSRVQTVGREPSLAPFRSVLEHFMELTGVPLLLNTSLNLGGKPIAASRADVMEFFRGGNLDAVCIGDSLIHQGKSLEP